MQNYLMGNAHLLALAVPLSIPFVWAIHYLLVRKNDITSVMMAWTILWFFLSLAVYIILSIQN